MTATGEIEEESRGRVMADLRAHFRPEFLNRVDEIALFKPLTIEEIERIVDLQIEDVRRRLAGRRITLRLTEEAREHIAREGYDPVYGARPLRRLIQHDVETRIGRALVAGQVADGSSITLDAEQGGVVVRFDESAAAEAEPREEAVAST